MWQDWVNGFLGLWLVMLAFLGVMDQWTLLFVGAAIAVLGFWAVARRTEREEDVLPYRSDMGLYDG
jgi:hypothetical protein